MDKAEIIHPCRSYSLKKCTAHWIAKNLQSEYQILFQITFTGHRLKSTFLCIMARLRRALTQLGLAPFALDATAAFRNRAYLGDR